MARNRRNQLEYMIEPMPLALRSIRMMGNVKQADLAVVAKVEANEISAIERGIKLPTRDFVEKMSSAFGGISCQVLTMPKDAFDSLIADDPHFRQNIVERIASSDATNNIVVGKWALTEERCR